MGKRFTLNADTQRFVRFCRTHLVFIQGTRTGEPLEFEPWQLYHTNSILERDPDTDLRRYTTAYVGLAKGNNKSTWGAALALFFLVDESGRTKDKGMQVYAAAASKEQARVVFDYAREMAEASPTLGDMGVKVGRNTITLPATKARFQVLAADAPKVHGKRPSVVICDELHAHETGDLYEALETAMVTRLEPLMVVITNAGADEDHGKCGEVYRRGLAGTDPAMYFTSPSVADDDVDNPTAWKRVNPLSTITVAKLLSLRAKLPPFVFERFHLNRWTRAVKDWLPKGAWAARAGDATIPGGSSVTLGVDMARSSDSAAVTICWPRMVQPEGPAAADGTLPDLAPRFIVQAETWAAHADPSKPPPQVTHVVAGEVIPYSLPMDAIREAMRRFNVYEVAFDPWRFDYPAEILLGEGVPMVELPQQPERMAEASISLFAAITEGELVHGDDDNLTIQIRAAVAAPVGATKWRLAKDKTKNHMDAAVSTAMAVLRARFYMGADVAEYDIRYM